MAPVSSLGPTSTAPVLTVGQVAERSGMSPSAVRFYERHGLISSIRTTGNQRRYDEYAPCMLRVTKVAQRVGLTLTEIAEIFDEIVPGDSTEEDWDCLTQRLIAEAEDRIDQLRAVLTDIATGRPLCSLPGA